MCMIKNLKHQELLLHVCGQVSVSVSLAGVGETSLSAS